MLSASTLYRSAMSAGIAAARIGLQRPPPQRFLQPLARRTWSSSTAWQLACARTYSDSGNGSSSSSSSSASASRIWYLAAAVPLVTMSSDSPLSAPPTAVPRRRSLPLNPEVATELSKGSILGFILGLLVSTFSKTLVLLVGAAITAQSLAARAGINLVQYFQLEERFRASRILAALEEHTVFKLAFGITFAMSAFMQF